MEEHQNNKINEGWTPPEKEPWWNDGDKMSGLFATVIFLGVAGIFLAFVVRLMIWIVTGEW